jgi:hypothetical protein
VKDCTGCLISGAVLAGTDQTYPASPLTPNTTYYWKVVNNPDDTDCDKSSPVSTFVTPNPPTTADIRVNTYQTESTVCSGLGTTLMAASSTIGLTGRANQVGNTASFINVPGSATYVLSATPPSGWNYICGDTTPTYATNGSPRSLTLPTSPVSPVTANFWYARGADPWWQVVGGDAYAATNTG